MEDRGKRTAEFCLYGDSLKRGRGQNPQSVQNAAASAVGNVGCKASDSDARNAVETSAARLTEGGPATALPQKTASPAGCFEQKKEYVASINLPACLCLGSCSCTLEGQLSARSSSAYQALLEGRAPQLAMIADCARDIICEDKAESPGPGHSLPWDLKIHFVDQSSGSTLTLSSGPASSLPSSPSSCLSSYSSTCTEGVPRGLHAHQPCGAAVAEAPLGRQWQEGAAVAEKSSASVIDGSGGGGISGRSRGGSGGGSISSGGGGSSSSGSGGIWDLRQLADATMTATAAATAEAVMAVTSSAATMASSGDLPGPSDGMAGDVVGHCTVACASSGVVGRTGGDEDSNGDGGAAVPRQGQGTFPMAALCAFLENQGSQGGGGMLETMVNSAAASGIDASARGDSAALPPATTVTAARHTQGGPGDDTWGYSDRPPQDESREQGRSRRFQPPAQQPGCDGSMQVQPCDGTVPAASITTPSPTTASSPGHVEVGSNVSSDAKGFARMAENGGGGAVMMPRASGNQAPTCAMPCGCGCGGSDACGSGISGTTACDANSAYNSMDASTNDTDTDTATATTTNGGSSANLGAILPATLSANSTGPFPGNCSHIAANGGGAGECMAILQLRELQQHYWRLRRDYGALEEIFFAAERGRREYASRYIFSMLDVAREGVLDADGARRHEMFSTYGRDAFRQCFRTWCLLYGRGGGGHAGRRPRGAPTALSPTVCQSWGAGHRASSGRTAPGGGGHGWAQGALAAPGGPWGAAGAVKACGGSCEYTMSMDEMLHFINLAEDKSTKASQSFWFQCLDLDGNGYLTRDELKFFYESVDKSRQPACVSFSDLMCQVYDMVRPSDASRGLSLADLRRSGLAPGVFNILLNHCDLLLFRTTLEWDRESYPL